MKLFKAPVLFAFFAVLVSFTAMASLGNPVSAGGNTINTVAPAPQAKEGDLNLRAVEAAERSATATEDEANTNFLILIFTGGAFVAAAFAAWFTRKTASDSEKYNKIQTRAYISIKKVKLKNVIIGGNIKIITRIENTGITPALDIKCGSMVITPDGDIHEVEIKIDEIKNILNNDELSSKSVCFPKQSFKSTIKSINLKNKIFLIFCIVIYKDIYGIEHMTTTLKYSDENIYNNRCGTPTDAEKYNIAT